MISQSRARSLARQLDRNRKQLQRIEKQMEDDPEAVMGEYRGILVKRIARGRKRDSR